MCVRISGMNIYCQLKNFEAEFGVQPHGLAQKRCRFSAEENHQHYCRSICSGKSAPNRADVGADVLQMCSCGF